MARKIYLAGLVLLATALLVAGCSTEQPDTPGTDGANTDIQAPPGDMEPVTGNVAAVVNGEEIETAEVDDLQRAFTQQGQNVSTDEALEHLIDQTLLLQAVDEAGITVPDEEAEAEIETQLSKQGVGLDEFKQQLDMQGASYEDELESVKDQLAIQEFVESETADENYTVSDEETEAFYEMYKQQTPEEEQLPFEEIEPQIRSMLEQQQQQEAVNSLVQEYREEADIEYR